MMKPNTMKIADLANISMFTALIAVISQIAIPLPTGVPITLQTFAVALCAYVLGSKAASLSILIYLFLGAVGLPVFSGFGAGAGKLLGLTGGFLWGFLLLTFFCGLRPAGRMSSRIFLGITGLFLFHLLGVLQFALVSGNNFAQAFAIASLPYLLKDIISVVLAYTLSLSVRKKLFAVLGGRRNE